MTRTTEPRTTLLIDGLWLFVAALVTSLVLFAVFALLAPTQSRAADQPAPPFAHIVDSFRAQLYDDALVQENARLRAKNHRLRRHLSAYGQWVRDQQRTIVHLREQSTLGWQVRNAISLAAVAYRQSEAVLLRKANCESHLWPFARNNSSADSPSGLFQFRPSTFASTPFHSFSIWDPYANALAASWMHDNGRGGEWACQ